MNYYKFQYEDRGIRTWYPDIISANNIVEAIGKAIAICERDGGVVIAIVESQSEVYKTLY
jgi:hypothetical protein